MNLGPTNDHQHRTQTSLSERITKHYLVSSSTKSHQNLVHNSLFIGNVIRRRIPQLALDIRSTHEVVVDFIRELEVISIHEPGLILALLRLAVLPLIAEILDLVDAVLLRVVVLAGAPHALPHRQMARVHGDAVVLGFSALAEVHPAAFLLLEIETGGVWEEEPSDEHACETEPGHEVELLLCVDVVVDHCCEEGAELAPGGGEAVGGGSNGGRENFRGHEEGDCIRTKLVEEGG